MIAPLVEGLVLKMVCNFQVKQILVSKGSSDIGLTYIPTLRMDMTS